MRCIVLPHYNIPPPSLILDRRPTMPELTDFPGKTQHFSVAKRIGINYLSVGTGLLNDERGEIVPAIVSDYRDNTEHINMAILRGWVQGKGIADHTWRGLLGVLRVHCPGLAQDIEETLTSETEKVQSYTICISCSSHFSHHNYTT